MSEEQNEKPQFQRTPINDSNFIKQVKDFFDTLPISREEKVNIFRSYELALNNGVMYPRQGLQRSDAGMRTFKHYYVSNCISFSSNADVKKYKEAQKEDRKYIVNTDYMEFERQCRMFGINSDISRANLYFDMKLSDFKQGIMQVHSDKDIYNFVCKYFEMYLKYEPKRIQVKKNQDLPIKEGDRQYLIEDLF